jgi:DNA gyrase subunit B
MSSDSPETPPPGNGPETEYEVSQMRYMSDLEHVRERSGMYIGNRDVRGLHHLVTEVVDNSDRRGDGRLCQGYPGDRQPRRLDHRGRRRPRHSRRGRPDIGRSALEGVMTMLKYGGKFGKKAYKTSGGLHGIGVKAVNFLSEWCEVEVRRGGHAYQQEYERGKPTGPVRRIGIAQGTGTKTTFKPDYQIFGDLKFDYNILLKAACRSWPSSTAA